MNRNGGNRANGDHRKFLRGTADLKTPRACGKDSCLANTLLIVYIFIEP